MLKIKKVKIYGINFIDANYEEIKSLFKNGGLIVLPSGPGLSDIKNNKLYHQALKNADIALFDSGYLCLLLRLKGLTVSKFSGYKFIKELLNTLKLETSRKILLVNPNRQESIINKKYFNSKRIYNVSNYNAPIYDKKKIIDYRLLIKIKKLKPKYIIINLGGGVQEILGSFLKNNLKYKPIIICSGAAISYFTKQQAPISTFLDNIYLGWFIRILFKPTIFLPRYLRAFKLFYLIIKHK